MPISFGTFVLLFLFLDVHNPKTPLVPGLKAVDWFGSLSILGFMVMLLLGLDFGGTIFPWKSPTVICLIVFGALMSVFFVFSEKKLAKYPIMPLEIFTDKETAACLAVGFAQEFVCVSSLLSQFAPLIITPSGRCCRRVLPTTILPISSLSWSASLGCSCSTSRPYGSFRRTYCRHSDPPNRTLRDNDADWHRFDDFRRGFVH